MDEVCRSCRIESSLDSAEVGACLPRLYSVNGEDVRLLAIFANIVVIAIFNFGTRRKARVRITGAICSQPFASLPLGLHDIQEQEQR